MPSLSLIFTVSVASTFKITRSNIDVASPAQQMIEPSHITSISWNSVFSPPLHFLNRIEFPWSYHFTFQAFCTSSIIIITTEKRSPLVISSLPLPFLPFTRMTLSMAAWSAHSSSTPHPFPSKHRRCHTCSCTPLPLLFSDLISLSGCPKDSCTRLPILIYCICLS